MREVIVIHEIDTSDNERTVIGVASSREKALKLISEYYGEGHTMSMYRDIREGALEFDCKIEVEEPYGGIYQVTTEYFTIDIL